MSQPSHLVGLNPEQLRAVTATDGPLLILAGAGSGKTRVLTRRVAHLLHTGADPEDILAVTFTNKAAHEMKERVIDLVGDVGQRVWVSTFHASCARILRMDIEPLGFTRRFAIWDDDDQARLIKEILAEMNVDADQYSPRDLLAQIDHHKNRMRGPDDLISERRSYASSPLVRVWRTYEDALRAADALDFNDLIGHTARLLETHEPTRDKWQQRFRYVLVDEYQDTNQAQYRLLRLLTAASGNLAVVGDDDQSIYGFRGADISNILNFERDYPHATVIRLEQNYRCSNNILAAANAVVRHNTGRIDKTLWTEADPGHQVTLIEADSPQREAQVVARGVHKLRRHGFAYGDMAVVYRTNLTSRTFEAELRALGIPHRIVGGKKFYERREVRDVLAYLRLITHHADDAAMLRVLNVPPRGIGVQTVRKLREEAASRGEPLLHVARTMSAGSGRTAKALAAFTTLVDELTDQARDLGPAALLIETITRSGYLAMLEQQAEAERSKLRSVPGRPSRQTDADKRRDNLQELVRDAERFEAPPEVDTPRDRLHAWLDRVALAGQDEEIPEGGEVTLMTVHNAKGLEYPVVFLVHMMEGQFPHSRSIDTNADIEEERRLAYVAFTRAKQRLVISRSRTWSPPGGGPPKPTAPSRFLFAIPPTVAHGDFPVPEGERVAATAGQTSSMERKQAAFRASRAAVPEPAGDHVLLDIESLDDLRVDRRVWHPKVGVGRITRVLPGSEPRIEICLDDGRRTRVPVRGGALRLVAD